MAKQDKPKGIQKSGWGPFSYTSPPPSASEKSWKVFQEILLSIWHFISEYNKFDEGLKFMSFICLFSKWVKCATFLLHFHSKV